MPPSSKTEVKQKGHRWAKGKPKTGGRKKGVQNKTTVQLKQAILDAFHEAGGVRYLKDVAQEHPAVFCALLGKIVPTEVHASVDGEIRSITRTIVDPAKAKK